MLKTTSQPVSEKLVKAGWVEETFLVWEYDENALGPTWALTPQCEFTGPAVLPAPTADEIAEGVSEEDIVDYFNSLIEKEKKELWPFARYASWLYTTRNSADAMADVWIKLQGKEAK